MLDWPSRWYRYFRLAWQIPAQWLHHLPPLGRSRRWRVLALLFVQAPPRGPCSTRPQAFQRRRKLRLRAGRTKYTTPVSGGERSSRSSVSPPARKTSRRLEIEGFVIPMDYVFDQSGYMQGASHGTLTLGQGSSFLKQGSRSVLGILSE
jgi:hypothetical protein